jgi:hypothetical protein
MAAVLPTLFFAVAATPVDVLGCATRGLLALALALLSLIAGVAAAAVARRASRRGEPPANRYVLSALILAIPGVALLFLA